MVGAVKVLSIPACGKVVANEDAIRAWSSGKIRHLPTSVLALQALVTKTDMGSAGCSWATNSHTEARLEALDRVLLDVVPGQVGLSIIDREPALSAGITIQIARVNRNNWHAVVGPVRRMLEVQGSSPIVGKVLGHFAGGTGSPRADITLHRSIEGVSTNDMVNMGRRVRAWLDDRIQTLDGQCAALETKSSLNRHNESERSRGIPLHVCG